MDRRRSVLLLAFSLFLVGSLVGCSSKDPTISKEEQERTRQHHEDYRESADY